MSKRPFIYAALAAAGICLSTPVVAIEIFGVKFFESEDPEDVALIDPLPYDAQLQLEGGDEDLIEAVERNALLLRNAARPALGRSGLLTTAQADYRRILDALYGQGRYGGTISIRVAGQEAANMPLNAALPERPQVVITVDPGPIYRFGRTRIINSPQTLDVVATGFVTGQIASAAAVGDTTIDAIKAWRDAGYAKAEVSAVEVVADHEAREIEATIEIETGPKATLGSTTISGTKAVDEPFLRYMTDAPKGEPFAARTLDDARRRLLKLDTFRRVTVEEAETLNPDGSLDVVVDLEDRAPRRIGFGATVSSLDGFGIEGFWLHRNIAGRAERLRFDAATSGIGTSSNPDDFNWELSTNFIKPGVITPDTDFSLTLSASRELAENYDARALMVTGGFATTFNRKLSGSIEGVLERSFTRDNLGKRDFITLGALASLTYDDRDVPLNATRGTYLDFDIEPFRELNFDNSGVRLTAEARNYQSFGAEDQFVLAGRAKLGALLGIAADVAPSSAQFFSGGGGSVRGYAYRANGVNTASGVTGGLSLLEVSAEMRATLTDRWGVVGFIDTGIVGADTTPDLSGPFKTGIGIGLRLNKGLGPIRFDLARGLDRTAGDPPIGIYIGLGQAF